MKEIFDCVRTDVIPEEFAVIYFLAGPGSTSICDARLARIRRRELVLSTSPIARALQDILEFIVVPRSGNVPWISGLSEHWPWSMLMKTRSRPISAFVVSYLLGIAISPSFADWNQFQADAAHTGYVAGAFSAANLEKIWSYPLREVSGGERSLGVAIVNNKVYATTLQSYEGQGSYQLIRLDGKGGALDWSREFRPRYDSVSAPSVSGGRVYLHYGGQSGIGSPNYPEDYPSLIGLDSDNGNLQFWTTHESQGKNIGQLTISAGDIFAQGGYFGGLDAYSLDGTKEWFHKLDGQINWVPAADDNYVYVYMGYGGGSPGPRVGSLFIMNRSDGSLKSTIQHPASKGSLSGELQSVMLGGRGDAFALTFNDHPAARDSSTLVCFDINADRILWERKGNFYGSPAVANGIVAVPNGMVLSVIDQHTGADLWSWTNFGTVSLNVVLTDRYAFVNSDRSVYAIDLRTHEAVWSSQGVWGKLALSGGLLTISNPTGIFAYSVIPEPSSFACSLGVFSIAMCACRIRRGHRQSRDTTRIGMKKRGQDSNPPDATSG